MHFNKFITLFVLAIEIIIYKKNWKEEICIFKVLMKFYLCFHMSSIISNTKGNTILQFMENISDVVTEKRSDYQCISGRFIFYG